MRNIGIDEALNRVAERTAENRESLRKSRFQRRTEFPDTYGVPFYAESQLENGKHRAKFYISLPPKYVYLLRFQFKLHVTTLATSGDGNFRIYMHGVDLTDLLTEQEDGEWIDGTGLYPTNAIEDEEDFYDILDAATILYNGNDGEQDDADRLLKPGFKPMVVEADSPFSCTMYLYSKYAVNGE